MSLRSFGTILFKHGTRLLPKISGARNIHTTKIINTINVAPSPAPAQVSHQALSPRNFAIRKVGVQIGLQARRILIDNVLNRVTNSLVAEMRRKAAKRIMYGDSAPFFALVGVSLASGTGILTKEDELEGVCWEIREAISKVKWFSAESDIRETVASLEDLTFGEPIAKGTNGVVYSAKLKTENEKSTLEFPLAVKMMFNYDIQSNSMAILNAMYRETVPAKVYHSNSLEWELDLSVSRRSLPAHPNIVEIFSVFTDYIQEFQDSRHLYPAALPPRLNPEGEGRNMSLFLLMKRYDTNLNDFLKTNPPLRTSILLFAQLLEAIAHLTAHGIAHRDLKSDNILLDLSEPQVPVLIISDFGCCLADKNNGLYLPYTTYDIDKGGNAALMAPEIVNQKPGTFSVLNYSKSDLWAAATIAYEMFGSPNPFYGRNEKLRSINYREEDLPKLSRNVPIILCNLIENLLKRNPNKRVDPEIAANICQIFLWAPSHWIKNSGKMPSNNEILQWLLSLTTKMLCEGGINNKIFKMSNTIGRRTYPEYLLISSFLTRAKLSNIRAALYWIKDNNYEIDY